MEDLLAAGVLDPAKVTRSGLTNACGIAGIMLTTQVRPHSWLCCHLQEPQQTQARRAIIRCMQGLVSIRFKHGRPCVPEPH